MTRKDYLIGLMILIDVLVVLSYGLSSFENLMAYLNYRPEVAFIFWIALIPLVVMFVMSYGKWVIKAIHK